MVELPANLLKATFLSRPNRFTVVAAREGEKLVAFLADPGRLAELLLPGAEVYLAPASWQGNRKTAYDVVLLRRNGVFISLDSRLPNRLFAAALQAGRLEPFKGCRLLASEVRAGSSRLDFLLQGEGQPPCYVEVKSVTLVRDGLALFPDAPTARGSRHLRELTALHSRGYRAAAVFIIQREDATGLAPNEVTDPCFASTIRKAAAAGVEIYAYRCRIDPATVSLIAPVEVKLQEK